MLKSGGPQARVVEDDPTLIGRLRDPDYPGKAERVVLFTLAAWDVNCQQHIHKRFSQRQIAPVLEKLQDRVRDLKTELAALRKRNDKSAPGSSAN